MEARRDPDARPCLYFLETGEQCRQPATFVCHDPDGMEWFACPPHADLHQYLRMPLVTYQTGARQQYFRRNSWWEVGPAATAEARAILAELQRAKN